MCVNLHYWLQYANEMIDNHIDVSDYWLINVYTKLCKHHDSVFVPNLSVSEDK